MGKVDKYSKTAEVISSNVSNLNGFHMSNTESIFQIEVKYGLTETEMNVKK